VDTLPELVGLGLRLAKARQSHGLSLEALADRLRLGVDQLEALESADLKRLPEPVFVVATARRVAAILGVDVEDDLAALRPNLLKARPTPLVSPAATTPPSPVEAHRFRLVPALILGALAIGAASLLLLRPWARPPQLAVAQAPAPSPPPAAVPAAAGAAAALAPDRSGDLLLSSAEASWIEVRDQGGKTLFQGTLLGEQRFPLGQGLQVMAGRPDLVRAKLGGQPERVLGPISAVQWRSFGPAPAAKAPKAAPAPEP
jgi:cytoskeletal protein RodZ